MFAHQAKAAAGMRPVRDRPNADAQERALNADKLEPEHQSPDTDPTTRKPPLERTSKHTESGMFTAGVAGKRLVGAARGRQQSMKVLTDLLEERDATGTMVLRQERYHERESKACTKSHFGQEMPYLIFHPYTTWRLGWDIFIMLIVLYTFFTVPVNLAFNDSSVRPKSQKKCNRNIADQSTMFMVDVIIDFLFLVDVALNFRTAYISKVAPQGGKEPSSAAKQSDSSAGRMKPRPASQGAATSNGVQELVTDWKQIAVHYLRGFFFLDVLASVPFDLIMLATPCPSPSQGSSGDAGFMASMNNLLRGPMLLKLFRLSRIVRLLKVERLKQMIMVIRDRLQLHPGRLRLLYFMVIIMLVMHWNACLFAMIGNMATAAAVNTWKSDEVDESQNFCNLGVSFLTENQFVTNSDDDGDGPEGEIYRVRCVDEMKWTHQWLMCLYWAVTTMTTCGYGDITPLNSWEMSFVIVALFEAGFAFSFFVGNIANLLKRQNLRLMKHQENLAVWDEVIHKSNLPKSVAERIRNHLQHAYDDPVSEMPVFARKDLPKTLLKDVSSHLYKQVLQRLPIFMSLDDNALTDLALSLKPLQMSPNTVVYKEGDWGDCVYFLTKGCVELSIMLTGQPRAKELGLRVVQDVQWSHMGTQNDVLSFETVSTDDDGNVIRKPYYPLLYKWRVRPDDNITYFGENVLVNSVNNRLSSVVTVKWSTLYRLSTSALKLTAKKHPGMRAVYRRLQKYKQTRFIRAVRVTLNSLRSRWAGVPKILVNIECAQNLPRMDGFLGKCDPYVKLQMGNPEPLDDKCFVTNVHYQQLNPTWNETFLIAIDLAIQKAVMRYKGDEEKTKELQNHDPHPACHWSNAGCHPVLIFSVYDHDQINSHDLVGFCELDLTDMIYKGMNAIMASKTERYSHTETQWMSVLRHQADGTLHVVDNGSRKHVTQLKVTVQFLGPPPESEKLASPTLGSPIERATDGLTMETFQSPFFGGGDLGQASTPLNQAPSDPPSPISYRQSCMFEDSLFPPPSPPSDPPSPDLFPHSYEVDRWATASEPDRENEGMDALMVANRAQMYGLGVNSNSVIRKSLPPEIQVDELLRELDGDDMLDVRPLEGRRREAGIHGKSSIRSLMEHLGRNRTLVEAKPIVDKAEDCNELMMLMAHISETTAKGQQQANNGKDLRGPVKIKERDMNGPSAPSGPKGGHAASSHARSWHSHPSSTSESESSRPASSVVEGGDDPEGNSGVPVRLLIRLINEIQQEHAADTREQCAKIFTLKDDFDQVCKRMDVYSAEVEALKQENKRLRDLVSEDKSFQ